ncbi:UDP:flavonoid glycosyltransferase YjiC (YdhE family) [Saccharothrix tamanrassetensis]|uniref:UDP:flavonoid glycosyltransferase YjiC (YdhE family) n=1 Tax=Saccharothrix tamanrassetensis TaxID=1051531 RepID=A0A841CIU1_9PSEU|nr:glycosyltransferase [Saccharothrix tamanrassetensis]MBB5956960.1 UDP:flavonoid glycosyltransferase YjiC (YdhE family) [Saccharothrix tamanrassetensis]
MRILFSSLGSHGHTYPLLPLAIAAREQGHDVTFATSADFAATIERLGLRHFAAGLDMRSAFTEAHGSHDPDVPEDELPGLIAKTFGSVMPRRNHADLTPFLAEWRPDLVVHEVGNPGAGLAARVAGVPGLCHGFGRMWDTDDMPPIGPHVLEFAGELGVEVPEEDPMLLGNRYLDVCPPSVQDKRFLAANDTIPLRPVPFAEPGGLPAWVAEHEQPLVYLTLGTAFGDPGVLRAAIDGLATLEGTRLLVAAGPTVELDALGEVPEHVVALPWVPQADLLPHTDLVVHHGGSGTTLGTFGAGVPQLVLPQGADQFSNADAVVAHGLGDRLLGDQVTAEAVADRARHLLADTVVRDAAKAIAAEVAAMPSPAEVAARLPEYAR